MSETRRLELWAAERGFDVATLAEATGDSYSTVYMMLTGRRPVSDAFKWRFAVRFGWTEAERIFDVQPIQEPA